MSLPSSCSMSIAAPVTGFVIEAIQNSVSGVIGRFAATSAKPVLSRCSTLSFATTTVTAPAISFFATISCIAAPTPGSVGSAANASCARQKAGNKTRRREFMVSFILWCFPADAPRFFPDSAGEMRDQLFVWNEQLLARRERLHFHLRPFVADQHGEPRAELLGGLKLLADLRRRRAGNPRAARPRAAAARAPSASARRSSFAITTYTSAARSRASHASSCAFARGRVVDQIRRAPRRPCRSRARAGPTFPSLIRLSSLS